jgi:hypothetical protein
MLLSTGLSTAPWYYLAVRESEKPRKCAEDLVADCIGLSGPRLGGPLGERAASFKLLDLTGLEFLNPSQDHSTC